MFNYDEWCRRIDLIFRARYPFLHTKIYKLGDYEYQIYVLEDIGEFGELEEVFNKEVRYVTAPVKLTMYEPKQYLKILNGISDENIPNGFSGLPFTLHQLQIQIESVHHGVRVKKNR